MFGAAARGGGYSRDKAVAVEIFKWMVPVVGLGLGTIISEDQAVGKRMTELKVMDRRISVHQTRSSSVEKAAGQRVTMVIAVMVSSLVGIIMDMVIIQGIMELVPPASLVILRKDREVVRTIVDMVIISIFVAPITQAIMAMGVIIGEFVTVPITLIEELGMSWCSNLRLLQLIPRWSTHHQNQ